MICMSPAKKYGAVTEEPNKMLAQSIHFKLRPFGALVSDVQKTPNDPTEPQTRKRQHLWKACTLGEKAEHTHTEFSFRVALTHVWFMVPLKPLLEPQNNPLVIRGCAENKYSAHQAQKIAKVKVAHTHIEEPWMFATVPVVCRHLPR
eukprot:5798351-Amphidinium_carterae.1